MKPSALRSAPDVPGAFSGASGALVLAIVLPFLAWSEPAAAGVTPHTVWTPEARASMPLWVQIWIPVLFLVFGAGLLFVRKRREAWWMVGAFAASHVLSGIELVVLGPGGLTVGLIAFNHVLVWTPAAICFAASTRGTPATSPFGLWRVMVLAVAGFSLVFDYRDAWVFFTTQPK